VRGRSGGGGVCVVRVFSRCMSGRTEGEKTGVTIIVRQGLSGGKRKTTGNSEASVETLLMPHTGGEKERHEKPRDV